MYTSGERDLLRDKLIEAARADDRVTGAALTGSGALDAEDAWSDIDLAFKTAAPEPVLADFTALMYREHGARHHMDVVFERTVFRVFLLDNTLQVDLAFWPEADFGATTPKFRLLFGTANERDQASPPDARRLVDLAWLHALHARSSIARGRHWQAEYMIGRVRDHALALACVRHDLPAGEGRGLDRLPAAITTPFEETLVHGLDDLARAFRAVTGLLIAEIERVDAELAGTLAPLLRAPAS
ncbi:nucleotidyltransferase domain-containing protein [Amycolatopsis sp. WQ 127309]|uniref:nucleotidyltransferase domain-containing protein n=1 Tax=Amycolatopsis sp. WQ 127309 TaxID=2932773 RepID=UPI001FF48EA6|nr:nucleotidyltransferase domain-containing protein [Amycolatopsis sp. WQ 127309]UOZ10307.1 nucleotidyltransferase domain-containing protein [Amycolatopsis sp. WQ 127309]